MKIFKRFLIIVGILAVLFQVPFSCAQRGTPGGGPIDTIPPVVVNAKPANFSTHFKAEKIRINFDEYIKLNDPNTQILISPPMEKKPIISPQGPAQKYVEIELKDNLKPNTTYTINFGQSIEDNNEGNPLPFYKYVFSTGDYIDSLSVSGKIKDAYNRKTDEFISVMLYKLDSTYSDSIIYKKPPTYIAQTQDSTHTFEIENIAEGKYKIFALKDKNQNYIFDPKTDKIGFLADTIELPTDQNYDLKVFREKREFKAKSPSQESLENLLFGIEGGAENTKVEMISEKPADFAETYYKDKETDSISYWFKPYFEADSLVFTVSKAEKQDTLVTKLKEIERDSLKIKANLTSVLGLKENFSLSGNTPFVEINAELIKIEDQDSSAVSFETKFNAEINELVLDFEKQEKQIYNIEVLPGAIKDFYQQENDTLNYTLKTNPKTDYADVELTLENISSYPVILQLADEKGETKREKIHQEEEGNVFRFSYVNPGKYHVRVIYDENNNGKWDTGNYLKNLQPEKVIYMSEPLDVRKNWEISQTFILKE